MIDDFVRSVQHNNVTCGVREMKNHLGGPYSFDGEVGLHMLRYGFPELEDNEFL